MDDAHREPHQADVDLKLPGGSLARLFGDSRDASIVGSIASCGGDYEPELMAVLSALVTRDSVSLDVGANVGPITLALSRLCPDGHVHAFEPAAESFAFLQRNIARNGARNVTPHRLALSDTIGQATLHYNREFSGGAFISDHLRDGVPEVVAVTALDAWAESNALGRLDLVKIDVEGGEGRVLTGGRATLARFRPTLVVELNPVCIKRMQRGDCREFLRRLRACYGAFGHLAVVSASGAALPVCSWGQLRRELAESAVCNLIVSPSRLLPGMHPRVAGPAATATALARGLLRYSRRSSPPWAAVVDPCVKIRTDGEAFAPGAPAISGRRGSRCVLPLSIENRAEVAIVGKAERFPVSVRVIWIDRDGNHRVDDRSRTPAPNLRPGSARALALPVYLPDEPGSYTMRVTLFQEQVAWFHDLDPASCLDLEVISTAASPGRRNPVQEHPADAQSSQADPA
jgi:FkbM family methyltransferase